MKTRPVVENALVVFLLKSLQ